ncbi:hypothetical protein BDM02DRAFT_3192532 [Thelephora ganbajun]|uniref:Uncharacterized protein n=1 Tax=Thelephora ganbajun TaxID=370292 RepID=A0ACB6YZL1_THEGA|nr:hypothetical protein BDM02DRAFT_3192532 [Thelephora ganbajun]
MSETIVHWLKQSHKSLRLYTEMELTNWDLTIGVLWAHVNALALMEVDLTTTEEFISAPSTPFTGGNTLMTNVSIQIKTPDLVIPEGVLIPIEDDDDEEVIAEVVAEVLEDVVVPEPVGIILPLQSFNWQDERAQGQEEYYRHQREEEECAHEELEYVPPPSYEDVFPDVIRADEARYVARYKDGRPTGMRGPSDESVASLSGTTRDD